MPPMVPWFRSIAPSLESFVVDASKEWNPALLNLMLDAASQCAPELRHLEVLRLLEMDGDGNELLLSISALTGLKALTFGPLIYDEHFSIGDILDLCRLECLEVWLDRSVANFVAAIHKKLNFPRCYVR